MERLELILKLNRLLSVHYHFSEWTVTAIALCQY